MEPRDLNSLWLPGRLPIEPNRSCYILTKALAKRKTDLSKDKGNKDNSSTVSIFGFQRQTLILNSKQSKNMKWSGWNESQRKKNYTFSVNYLKIYISFSFPFSLKCSHDIYL